MDTNENDNHNLLRSNLDAAMGQMHGVLSRAMPSTAQAVNLGPSMVWDRDVRPGEYQFQALDPTVPVPSMIQPQYIGGYELSVPSRPATPPKPKKPAKLKKANEKQVAKAIVKHSKKKTEQVKRQADMLDATAIQTEQRLKNEEKQLRKTKIKAEFFKKQTEKLNKGSKALEKEFAQTIKSLKEREDVAGITIDDRGRIIVTTAPLFTTYEGWDEPKMAGRYQIRIDFSRASVHSGIKVLNITHRKDEHYDSPTISNTRCCWGNIFHDISTSFLAQDLEEIVSDMIEYIASPNTQHGYLGMEGSKNRGWDSFFDKVTDMPDDYSWEKYDATHTEENDDYPDEVDTMGNMPRDSIAVPSDYRDDYIRNLERRLQDTERQIDHERSQRGTVQADNVEDQKLKLLLNYIGLSSTTQDYVYSHFRSNGTNVLAMRILPIGGRDIVTLRMYREHEPTREVSIIQNDFAGSRIEETIREESAVCFDLNSDGIVMDITQQHVPIGTNWDDPSSMTQTRHRESVTWEVLLNEYRRDENRPQANAYDNMLTRYADASGALTGPLTTQATTTVTPIGHLATQYRDEVLRHAVSVDQQRRLNGVISQRQEASVTASVTANAAGTLTLGRLGEMIGIGNDSVATEDPRMRGTIE